MDFSKLTRLRQMEILKPCPENWDAMEGDEKQRFCAGCGCHVHNISEMAAEEAEDLLNRPGRTCTRIETDVQRGVLTKDGWIPRLLLVGAVASSVAGCEPTVGYDLQHTSLGESVARPAKKPPVKKKPEVRVTLGEQQLVPASRTMLGKPMKSVPPAKPRD